ncbi:nadh-ubiquinone oxidoreductase 213 kda subunit [Moniliophthora roreri MCA 2997]|uniref:Nadh-ubiquinone oxidoreductase 213 kDa subunit n=2 Tax=Moniliophthora roreri TaxID=221103 RepID=V2XYH8_MONRO|nr:nadh-ubiquinone oxidoreductase 213 kda subunit [Moniliophthora roreri MCA 2997]KAI3622164.1 nadh-ubiquinone oxidoreductase 213 kda subunit [Moniliophthora roreri]
MSEFEPKSTLQSAAKYGIQAGAVGLVVSSLQNALGQHSRGATGVLTRTGGTITFFAAMGATFAFTEALVANQRQKNDAYNSASGACAAGFLAGIKTRSIPAALGGCAFLGTVVGVFDATGEFTGTRGAQDEERRNRFLKKPLDLSTSD